MLTAFVPFICYLWDQLCGCYSYLDYEAYHLCSNKPFQAKNVFTTLDFSFSIVWAIPLFINNLLLTKRTKSLLYFNFCSKQLLQGEEIAQSWPTKSEQLKWHFWTAFHGVRFWARCKLLTSFCQFRKSLSINFLIRASCQVLFSITCEVEFRQLLPSWERILAGH